MFGIVKPKFSKMFKKFFENVENNENGKNGRCGGWLTRFLFSVLHIVVNNNNEYSPF
jgi:hypothetical protein